MSQTPYQRESTHPKSSSNSQHQHHHQEETYTLTENEERLTDALRQAAESRLMLVSRLEENAKQSAKQTEMVTQLIKLHQTVSSMREKEAELLEEIDGLKDELARVRNNNSNNRGDVSLISMNESSVVHNQNQNQQQNSNNDESSIQHQHQQHVINEEVQAQELYRLRSENTALKTQCEFLAEEVKSTIALAASSQKRSAELSRIISHDVSYGSGGGGIEEHHYNGKQI